MRSISHSEKMKVNPGIRFRDTTLILILLVTVLFYSIVMGEQQKENLNR